MFTRILKRPVTFQVSSDGKNWKSVSYAEFALYCLNLSNTGYSYREVKNNSYQVAVTYYK